MKKILLIIVLSLLILIKPKMIKASHHENFEELNLTRGKLITDYSNKELNQYYNKVMKKKFWGWNTYTINNRVKASFISETIFSYYNDGFTAIDYNYKLEEQVVSKYSFSTTGSIAVNVSKNKTGFKGGLDSQLKLSYTLDKNTTKKEVYEIKMKIDPGTQVNLYIYGEGRLTNGVASEYVLWIRKNLGGFEVFEVSTQYHRLEKVRI